MAVVMRFVQRFKADKRQEFMDLEKEFGSPRAGQYSHLGIDVPGSCRRRAGTQSPRAR